MYTAFQKESMNTIISLTEMKLMIIPNVCKGTEKPDHSDIAEYNVWYGHTVKQIGNFLQTYYTLFIQSGNYAPER